MFVPSVTLHEFRGARLLENGERDLQRRREITTLDQQVPVLRTFDYLDIRDVVPPTEGLVACRVRAS